MSYPDVVIACIEHKVSLEVFRAIEAALVKHDNNMKDYSLVVDWITITANHSNYLVCDRANTQSRHRQKVVKLQLNYCNALVIKVNLQYRPVRREERGMFILQSLLIDAYAFFDVSLRRQASMTQAEKFLTLFAQERC